MEIREKQLKKFTPVTSTKPIKYLIIISYFHLIVNMICSSFRFCFCFCVFPRILPLTEANLGAPVHQAELSQTQHYGKSWKYSAKETYITQ